MLPWPFRPSEILDVGISGTTQIVSVGFGGFGGNKKGGPVKRVMVRVPLRIGIRTVRRGSARR